MNDLCADIGYKSINHVGEELCGDHVDVVEENENSTVIVLADGLGSGVKASILSTLTSKIISTMMAAGLPIEECVSTIAATLPVCSLRGVAYSTFTIIHLLNNEIAEIIHAKTKQDAKTLAKSVICSSLTKAAIYGHDANWGRILCALGYSGVDFDPENVELFFQGENGTIQIFKDGVACDYSEEEASKILAEPEVRILVDMKSGEAEACAWGCDLTYDYVKINADYRS